MSTSNSAGQKMTDAELTKLEKRIAAIYREAYDGLTDIIKERLALVAPNTFDELKFDLIGCNSLYWNPDYKYNEEPSEVRVRVAGRAKTKAEADIIGNEVEALYTNGPAGGCGAVKRTRDIVSVASILVSRYDVKPAVEIFEV